MIALNQYIEKKEDIEKFYKIKKLNFNFEKLNFLVDNFKITTKQAEKVRSDCNKWCGEMADVFGDTSKHNDVFKTIIMLDRKACKLQNKAKKQFKNINRILSKLYNLPDKIILESKTSLCNEKCNLTAKIFVNQLIKANTHLKIKTFFRQNKNAVLNQNDFSLIFQNNNCFNVLLQNKELFEDLKNEAINKSLKVTEISSIELPKNASEKFIFEFSNKTTLELSFVGQFDTRQYNIKFKDMQNDITKFPIQFQIKTN